MAWILRLEDERTLRAVLGIGRLVGPVVQATELDIRPRDAFVESIWFVSRTQVGSISSPAGPVR